MKNQNRPFYPCTDSMPALGVPVEIRLSDSGFRHTASLDITEVNQIYVWCCEYGGVFYSETQVDAWREWNPPAEPASGTMEKRA